MVLTRRSVAPVAVHGRRNTVGSVVRGARLPRRPADLTAGGGAGGAGLRAPAHPSIATTRVGRARGSRSVAFGEGGRRYAGPDI